MTELTYPVPKVGDKVTSAEPAVGTALTEIKTVVNGKISAVNLEAKAVEDAAIAANRALVTTNGAYSVKTFTKAEAEAGVEPSATRLAYVSLKAIGGETEFNLGGATIGTVGTAASSGFLVLPGKKWKTLQEVATVTLLL